MERALIKLAQQLNQYDESSLMELWQSYAAKVAGFEPSVRWEENALAFCMIQAVHWKNQLFNAELSASARRGGKKADDKELKAELASLSKNRLEPRPAPPDQSAGKYADKPAGQPGGAKSARGKKPCKVLVLRPSGPGKP